MTYTTAKPEMTGDLMELWELCFGDERPYVELFFQRRFVCENGFVVTHNEKPVAALYALPFVLAGNEKSFPAAYIYGVATHPDFRGQGLSTKLLAYANNELRHRGVEVTVLIPASESLFGFYGKQGYRTMFWLERIQVEARAFAGENIFETGDWGADAVDQMERKRNAWLSGPGYSGIWDRAALDYALEETRFLGGELVPLGDGYSLCVADAKHKKVWVRELCVPGPDSDVEGVLGLLARRYPGFALDVRLDVWHTLPGGVKTPYAMAFGLTEEAANTVAAADEHSPNYFGLGLD